jgi:dTDP-4-amino-4,6-dideoxygalactose transaminase
MTRTAVPYVDLGQQHRPLKGELLAAVERVLDHGGFILGPEVEAFEEAFAALCGSRHAIGVDNGTSALMLTLRGLCIGPGDEVITAPNSFLASASAIALVGARPVFADVGDDYNLDPERLEAAITPRTRAIIPVHLTGRPAAMDPILDLAARHDLAVIEDAAQAVGARYRDRPVGSLGKVGCFSLHPLKNLSAAGDAGIITTDDDRLAAALRQARNHGLRDRDACDFWSPNCRLDALHAAMLRVKLEKLGEWTAARRRHAAFYREALRDVVQVPEELPHEHAVYHTFIIQAERRDALQRFLEGRGIATKVHYPIPIHRQKAAADLGYGPGSFPRAEAQAGRILSLPVYPELTVEQRQAVVEGIHDFYHDTAPGGAP